MRTGLVLLWLSWTVSVQASPLELYGIGLRGVGRGLANTAGTRDVFATFYNPAGLMEIESIEFALMHQINAPWVSIDMERTDPAFEPAFPAIYQNTSVALAVPLTGRLAGKASLGALLEVPNGILVRARTLDARRPHWFMYDSYPDIFISQIALAFSFFDGFNLAVGIHNNSGFKGQINAQIDINTNTWSQREIDFEFTGQYGPTVGAKFSYKRLHLGVVYRSPLTMDFSTPAELTVNELDAGMRLDLAGAVHPIPMVIASGLEWRAGHWSLELAGQWKQWSSVDDPSVDISIDVQGSDADSLGLGRALDVPDAQAQPRQSPGFRDTLSLGLGTSYKWSQAVEGHASYSFMPSPIPDQIQHTNLIDHDRHVLGLSVIRHFKDPFGVFMKPLSIGPSIQWNHLAKRQVQKRMGVSDPVGDWTAQGGVLSLTFGVQGAL